VGDCLTGWVTWLVTGAWGMLKGRVSADRPRFNETKQARSSRFIPRCADLVPVMTSTLIGLFWDLTVPYVR